MPRVIVGFDGSQASERALRWAYENFAGRSLSLTVVTVVDERPIPGSALAVPADPEDVEMARRVAQEAVAALGDDPHVAITVIASAGQPAWVLLDLAREPDHLVVGSRGIGGFSRLLLGSVSTQVVHHATCPVTVIPLPHVHERTRSGRHTPS
jgi:nucleotide-binding universal stress UspA family protein